MKKKSFLFYLDSYTDSIKALTYEQKGMLFDAMVNHAGGKAEEPELGLLSLAFDHIKASMDRDLIKYNAICERNKKNGQKGGRPAEPNVTQPNPKEPSGLSGNPKEPDKDSDTDKDSEKDSDIEITKAGIVEEVVSYLNKKAGKRFSPKTSTTISFIEKRVAGLGLTIDDFKTVIDNKVISWKGTDHDKFLRPETLFGNKMEGYLNENPVFNGVSNQPQTKQGSMNDILSMSEMLQGASDEQLRIEGPTERQDGIVDVDEVGSTLPKLRPLFG